MLVSNISEEVYFNFVFGDMTQCLLINIHRCFGGFKLHAHSLSSPKNAEDEESSNLRKVGNYEVLTSRHSVTSQKTHLHQHRCDNLTSLVSFPRKPSQKMNVKSELHTPLQLEKLQPSTVLFLGRRRLNPIQTHLTYSQLGKQRLR